MVTPQTPVASIQTLQSSAGQEQPTSAGHFSFPPAARNAPTLNSGLMSPFAAPFEPARVVELSPLSVTALPLQVTPPDMYPLSGAQVDAVAFQLARRMHLTAARWQLLVHDDVITYRFDLDQRPCGTRTVEVGVPHFPAITGLVVTETYHYRRVSLLRLVIDFSTDLHLPVELCDIIVDFLQPNNHSHLEGVRVGEALKPGPPSHGCLGSFTTSQSSSSSAPVVSDFKSKPLPKKVSVQTQDSLFLEHTDCLNALLEEEQLALKAYRVAPKAYVDLQHKAYTAKTLRVDQFLHQHPEMQPLAQQRRAAGQRRQSAAPRACVKPLPARTAVAAPIVDKTKECDGVTKAWRRVVLEVAAMVRPCYVRNEENIEIINVSFVSALNAIKKAKFKVEEGGEGIDLLSVLGRTCVATAANEGREQALQDLAGTLQSSQVTNAHGRVVGQVPGAGFAQDLAIEYNRPDFIVSPLTVVKQYLTIKMRSLWPGGHPVPDAVDFHHCVDAVTNHLPVVPSVRDFLRWVWVTPYRQWPTWARTLILTLVILFAVTLGPAVILFLAYTTDAVLFLCWSLSKGLVYIWLMQVTLLVQYVLGCLEPFLSPILWLGQLCMQCSSLMVSAAQALQVSVQAGSMSCPVANNFSIFTRFPNFRAQSGLNAIPVVSWQPWSMPLKNWMLWVSLIMMATVASLLLSSKLRTGYGQAVRRKISKKLNRGLSTIVALLSKWLLDPLRSASRMSSMRNGTQTTSSSLNVGKQQMPLVLGFLATYRTMAQRGYLRAISLLWTWDSPRSHCNFWSTCIKRLVITVVLSIFSIVSCTTSWFLPVEACASSAVLFLNLVFPTLLLPILLLMLPYIPLFSSLMGVSLAWILTSAFVATITSVLYALVLRKD